MHTVFNNLQSIRLTEFLCPRPLRYGKKSRVATLKCFFAVEECLSRVFDGCCTLRVTNYSLFNGSCLMGLAWRGPMKSDLREVIGSTVFWRYRICHLFMSTGTALKQLNSRPALGTSLKPHWEATVSHATSFLQAAALDHNIPGIQMAQPHQYQQFKGAQASWWIGTTMSETNTHQFPPSRYHDVLYRHFARGRLIEGSWNSCSCWVSFYIAHFLSFVHTREHPPFFLCRAVDCGFVYCTPELCCVRLVKGRYRLRPPYTTVWVV